MEVTIIDETYNASPISVREALRNIGDIECTGSKIAILGDMLELGDNARELHEDLLHDILRNQIDKVYTIGELSKSLFYLLPDQIQGKAFDTHQGVAAIVKKEINAGDVILVKASNGIGLSAVVEDLTLVVENAV